MDMSQYLEMFIEETKEHIQAINTHVLTFEKEPSNLNIINEIFRSAHTLKGMAATMGFENLASLTHELENVLDLLRNKQRTASNELIDLIFQSIDVMEGMLSSIIETGSDGQFANEIIHHLQLIIQGDQPSTSLESRDLSVTEPSEASTQFNYFQLDDFVHTVLKQSYQAGFHVYELKVTIRENCILKAARSYMVFNLLEQYGEVIKSLPTVEDIEAEKFDDSFFVIYISKENQSFIKDMVLKVSEIESIECEEIQIKTQNYSNKTQLSEEKNKIVDESITANSPVIDEKTNSIPIVTDKGDISTDLLSSLETENKSEQLAKPQSGLNRSIRVNIDKLDVLMNLFSELVIDRGRLEQISKEIAHSELQETVEHMSRISGDLQNLILTMRMVPIEQVFNRFPRMVRELSKELNKKIDFIIHGAETELDRTVIDEIGDPLVHLIRNAIDHGLESAEERIRKGKNEVGNVQLKAFHSGNHVFIELEDDGNGIDREKVLHKAVQKNIVSLERAQELTDTDIYQFLFASGFSTADKISDISGRGVGLDVVKNKIESLGGSVTVSSEKNVGTKFSIQLPLTLSILSAMLVNIAEEKYAIPITSIMETAVFKPEQIKTVHGQRVIDFRGKIVPLVSMRKVFELDEMEQELEMLSVVIVKKGQRMAGLIVDSFIGQQEIVLKSLGKYLQNVFAISGATILGDGQVALIIDCNALIK